MSARTDLVARLPWVTRLKQTQDCDGYRWSHLWAMGLQHDMAEQERTFRGLARLVTVDEWNAMIRTSPVRLVAGS